MRLCYCGCQEFDVRIVDSVEVDAVVSFKDSDSGNIIDTGGNEESLSLQIVSHLFCKKCGAEYDSEQFVPTEEEVREEMELEEVQ